MKRTKLPRKRNAAIRKISTDEIIRVVKEHPEKINGKNLQQINGVFTLFKEGTIGGSQFLKLAEKQIKLGVDIWRRGMEHRINANMRLSFQMGAGDILKRIKSLRQTARDMSQMYPMDPDSLEHKQLIADIDKTIEELQLLKKDILMKRGFYKTISTKNGTKYIPNI